MSIVGRLAARLPGYGVLRELMDRENVGLITARLLCSQFYRARGTGLSVLDLGCGEGSSLQWFEELDSQVQWHGVDIEDSPEVMARRAQDPRMLSFDGVSLPFAADVFDIVYCHQVLEHVHRPYELMNEVQRVLRPGGTLIGSVAYLEPYHSFSVFNFTPYGMKLVLESAHLEPSLLKHSSDAFYKIFRQMLGGSSLLGKLSRVSTVYCLLSILGRLTGADPRDVNLLKIQYAGSFCFVARKPM